MPIWETFSKRQKRLERAGKSDVFQYDDLPRPFRVQVVHIWRSSMGAYRRVSPSNEYWTFIRDTLTRESGKFDLCVRDNPDAMCENYLLTADSNGALDIIELSFQVIDRAVRKMASYLITDAGITQAPEDAIEELNHRFREHGLGYQYLGGQLVRIDSQFAHAEIVKPALSLLHEAGFDGAEEEFLGGFEHYRHGRNKEAIAEALKAFESTMKAICAARKWNAPSNATAKPLIGIMFEKGLIPSQLESHFMGLRSAMESGLPTLSNSTSRHGQGAIPITIPPHFAAYALHLCASNIVFLIHAHKSLK